MRAVNTENVEKVIQAMKSVPKDRLITNGLGKRLTVSRYSFDYFMFEKGAFKSTDHDRGEEYVSTCLFHTDKTPSFSYNSEKGVCNCLSCGRGGSFLKLSTLYDVEIVGRKIGVFDKLEEFLILDKELSALAGVTSIYSSEELIDLENIKFNRPKIKKEYYPLSLLDVQTKLSKSLITIEDKIRFIALVQEGLSPKDIYQNFTGKILDSLEPDKVLEQMQGILSMDFFE